MQYADLYNNAKLKNIYFEEYTKEVDKLSKLGYKGYTLTEVARACASATIKQMQLKLRKR